MKKGIPVAILLLLGLLSCKNNDNTIQFKALNEGLKQYGNNIRGSNVRIENALREKLQDARTAAKASIWQPKAAYVKAVADSMAALIETLKATLKKEAGLADTSDIEMADGNTLDAVKTVFEKQGNAEILYHKLLDFNEKVLSVLNPDEFKDNPVLEGDVKKVREELQKQFPINKETPVVAWFKDIGTPAALAMLSKLQIDVTISANELMSYCNTMVVYYSDSFESFTAIATQNSTSLKGGQLLEITAGIGAFSVASRPQITINGKLISLEPEGVAIYKIKTPEKPGNYSVPVKIEFVKPDGSTASITKKIKYTVEE